MERYPLGLWLLFTLGTLVAPAGCAAEAGDEDDDADESAMEVESAASTMAKASCTTPPKELVVNLENNLKQLLNRKGESIVCAHHDWRLQNNWSCTMGHGKARI